MAERRLAFLVSAYLGLKAPLVRHLLGLGLTLGRRKDTKIMPVFVPRLHGAACLNAALKMARDALRDVDESQRYTHVLWLDRDVMLTGEQAERLLSAVDPWHPAVFAWDGAEIPGPSDSSLVRAASARLSAAAFDADLFSDLRQPWFDHWPDTFRNFHKQNIPLYCHTGIRPYRMIAPKLEGGAP